MEDYKPAFKQLLNHLHLLPSESLEVLRSQAIREEGHRFVIWDVGARLRNGDIVKGIVDSYKRRYNLEDEIENEDKRTNTRSA